MVVMVTTVNSPNNKNRHSPPAKIFQIFDLCISLYYLSIYLGNRFIYELSGKDFFMDVTSIVFLIFFHGGLFQDLLVHIDLWI